MKASFDQVAQEYDRSFTNSAIGRAQRKLVWNHMAKSDAFKGRKILEVNCGTGEDAVHMASQNNRVVATDISAPMVDEVNHKIALHQLLGRIETFVCDMRNLSELPSDFDTVFSNFGGLNCLGPKELEQVRDEFAARLAPGGRLVVVVMPSFCLWESLFFLAKGRGKAVFRRNTGQAVESRIAPGTVQSTWYYSPRRLISLFAPAFSPLKVRAIGFFVPPSFLETFFGKRRGMLDRLCELDQRTNAFSVLASASDHYLVEFESRT